MPKKQIPAPKKSILHDYLRDVYTEFAELVCNELEKKHPKSKCSVQVKKVVEKILEEHFGKDAGGGGEFE